MTAPSPWVEYTWEGIDGWLWQGMIFSPADNDPSGSGTTVLFLAPPGGRGSIPPPAQGPPGAPSPPRNVFVNQVAPGGTIPSPQVDVVDPATGVWDLTFWVNSGADGPTASVALLAAVDLSGATGAQLGDFLVYETGSGIPEMTFNPALAGGKFYPTTVNSTTSGNGPQRTLAQVAVPAQRFAWTPKVSGGAVVVGTGANVQVNLVARLNSTTGDDVGLGIGVAGQYPPPITLWDGGPAGSSPTTYGIVAAGSGATIFLQAEQQSGTDSFTTSASTTRFCVEMNRIS
jgi:hypothetical protein